MEGELRGVVELLAGCLPQRRVLVEDTHSVERGLHVQEGLPGGFEDRIEPAEHGQGEDDVAVLAADVDIAEYMVRDAPDVAGDPVEVGGGGHELVVYGCAQAVLVCTAAERLYHDGRCTAPV